MKIEQKLYNARFIKRLNRFEALVEVEGVEQLTHVPNTGRLKELLLEGAEVMVGGFDKPERKTRYGLLLVRKGDVWVSIDSANVPNKIMHEALLQKEIDIYGDYDEVRREVTISNSRLDFGLFKDNKEYYIEVKGVTLVEGRQALFPDAPTVRGTRHIEELIRIKLEGKGAGVVFIIQRDDADILKPNDTTDRKFGDSLRKAEDMGVDIHAYTCRIDVKSGRIDIARQIPVSLGI
ncbi:MAG: DNA/RNA nuclease SfsA [Clostridium sp.]|nr:DNA/RNA nuclease SfsA [Clostridium sp.]